MGPVLVKIILMEMKNKQKSKREYLIQNEKSI